MDNTQDQRNYTVQQQTLIPHPKGVLSVPTADANAASNNSRPLIPLVLSVLGFVQLFCALCFPIASPFLSHAESTLLEEELGDGLDNFLREAVFWIWGVVSCSNHGKCTHCIAARNDCSTHDVLSYAVTSPYLGVVDPQMVGATVVFVVALALSIFTMVFTARKQGRTLQTKHMGATVSFCSAVLTGAVIVLVTTSKLGKDISAAKTVWCGQYFMWTGCPSMLACAVSVMFYPPATADAMQPQFHASNSPVQAPAQV